VARQIYVSDHWALEYDCSEFWMEEY